MEADQLIDMVRDDASRLRPDLADKQALRTIESRFLHVQPALDGALSGYFELDPEAGATFLEGLEVVMDLPTDDELPASVARTGQEPTNGSTSAGDLPSAGDLSVADEVDPSGGRR